MDEKFQIMEEKFEVSVEKSQIMCEKPQSMHEAPPIMLKKHWMMDEAPRIDETPKRAYETLQMGDQKPKEDISRMILDRIAMQISSDGTSARLTKELEKCDGKMERLLIHLELVSLQLRASEESLQLKNEELAVNFNEVERARNETNAAVAAVEKLEKKNTGLEFEKKQILDTLEKQQLEFKSNSKKKDEFITELEEKLNLTTCEKMRQQETLFAIIVEIKELKDHQRSVEGKLKEAERESKIKDRSITDVISVQKNITTELEEKVEIIANLHKELKQKGLELENTNHCLSNAKKSIINHEEKSKSEQETIASLKKSLSSSKDEISENRREIQTLIEEREKMMIKQKEMETLVKEDKKRIFCQKNDIESLCDEKQNLMKKLSGSTRVIEEMKLKSTEDNESLISSCSLIKYLQEEKRDDIASLEKKLEQLRHERYAVVQAKQQEIDHLRTNSSSLSKDLKNTNAKVSALNKEISQLKKNLSRSNQTRSNSADEVAGLKTKYSELRHEHDSARRGKQQEIDLLQSTLSSLSKELSNLKDKLMAQREDKSQLEMKLFQYSQARSSLVDEVSCLKKKCSKLREERDSILQDKQDGEDHLEPTSSSLKYELSNSGARVLKLNADLTRLNDEVSKKAFTLFEETIRLKKECSRLESAMKEKDSLRQNLEDKMKENLMVWEAEKEELSSLVEMKSQALKDCEEKVELLTSSNLIVPKSTDISCCTDRITQLCHENEELLNALELREERDSILPEEQNKEDHLKPTSSSLKYELCNSGARVFKLNADLTRLNDQVSKKAFTLFEETIRLKKECFRMESAMKEKDSLMQNLEDKMKENLMVWEAEKEELSSLVEMKSQALKDCEEKNQLMGPSNLTVPTEKYTDMITDQDWKNARFKLDESMQEMERLRSEVASSKAEKERLRQHIHFLEEDMKNVSTQVQRLSEMKCKNKKLKKEIETLKEKLTETLINRTRKQKEQGTHFSNTLLPSANSNAMKKIPPKRFSRKATNLEKAVFNRVDDVDSSAKPIKKQRSSDDRSPIYKMFKKIRHRASKYAKNLQTLRTTQSISDNSTYPAATSSGVGETQQAF